jgi:hypothetical protein
VTAHTEQSGASPPPQSPPPQSPPPTSPQPLSSRSQSAPPTAPPPRRLWRPSAAAGVALAAALLAAATAGGCYYYFLWGLGPEQPIPFSHRVHVTDKHISCIFCHNGVAAGETAAIPPLETCMLCHSKIIINHPKIRVLRDHGFAGRPVPWQRVNVLQEFVYFNHEVHIRAGFDCGKCHGDVPQMDRIVASPEFTMGFCRDCHRDQNFSVDCLICHR